jgi:hypothetical protein
MYQHNKLPFLLIGIRLNPFKQLIQRTMQYRFKGLGQFTGHGCLTVTAKTPGHITQAGADTMAGLVNHQRDRHCGKRLQALSPCRLFRRQEPLEQEPVRG